MSRVACKRILSAGEGAPFIFAAGHKHSVMPASFQTAIHCEKSSSLAEVAKAMFDSPCERQPGR